MKDEHPSRAEQAFRNEFCRYCRRLYERRLVTGVGGNMAARSSGTIYITPSGFSLGDLKPHDLVQVHENRPDKAQGKVPSREAAVHLGLLELRDDINVVCHVHGAYITAASTMMEPGPSSLPPLTPGFVHLAWPLPMIRFIPPGAEELRREILSFLARDDSRALMMQNHGLIVVGSNFRDAVNIAEEIDEAARVFVLSRGKAETIPERDIPRIR